MSLRVGVAASVAALFALSGSANAQPLTEHNVSLKMALTIAQAALAECTSRVSVAVVDRTGRLKVFLQGDGAQPHNIELARRKAYTARAFRRPSLEWAKRSEGDLAGQRMLTDVIPLGGGVPIKVGDDVIGAVGVSGTNAGQQGDEDCAKAAIAKVADQLK